MCVRAHTHECVCVHDGVLGCALFHASYAFFFYLLDIMTKVLFVEFECFQRDSV